MPGGSSSLFGFVYQLFLSLVVLLDESSSATPSTLETISALSSTSATLDASDISGWDHAVRRESVIVRVALEGRSDIDVHGPNHHVGYIQAKAHPESNRTWTPAPLFREVLQKLPDMRDAPTGTFSYLLVTDTELSAECQNFLSACRWLKEVAPALPSEATDQEWRDFLATVDDNGLRISFRSAGLWNNQQFSCCAKELPERLVQVSALRKVGASAPLAVNGANRSSRSRATLSSQPFTLAETCRFLAAFDIALPITHDELTTHLTRKLQDYVPRDAVSDTLANLLREAIVFATRRAGQLTTGAEFLQAIGIHGEPIYYPNVTAACRRMVEARFRQFVLPSDIPVAAVRERAEAAFSEFLNSTEYRIFLLLGEPNVGKSRQIAEWARRNVKHLPTVLVHARTFSWDNIATHLWQALGHEGRTPSFNTRALIERLHALRPDDPAVFLLCIDAIEEADNLPELKDKLRELWEQIGNLPIKVAISCKSTAWSRYAACFEAVQSLCFPLSRPDPVGNAQSLQRSRSVMASETLTLLTDSELHGALQANNLYVQEEHVSEEEWFGSNSARRVRNPLLQQLSHPALLNIFYQIRNSRPEGTPVPSYAVVLYERFWSDRCRAWANQAHRYEDDASRSLEDFADVLRRLHASENACTVDALRQVDFPFDMQWSSRASSSPAEQAFHLGLLRRQEGGDSSSEHKIAFGTAYLLEYALFRQLQRTLPRLSNASEEHQTILKTWLAALVDEVRQNGYDPLFYALAFLTQYLCHNEPENAHSLVQALLSYTFSLRLDVFFAFVADAATPYLAEVVEQNVPDIAWLAARRLGEMGTPQSGHVLIQLLLHRNAEVREHALQQIRTHPEIVWYDGELVDRLISLPNSEEGTASGWATEMHLLPETLELIAYSDLDAGGHYVLRTLEEHLGDTDVQAQKRCAQALIGIAHRSCVSSLRQALQTPDRDIEVKLALGAALARINDPDDIGRLLTLGASALTASPLSVYYRGLILSSLIEHHWLQARPSVEAILAQPQQGPDRSLDMLLEAMSQSDAGSMALRFLEQLLLTDSMWTRSHILYLIGLHHTPQSIHMLLQAVVEDFAIWARTEIGPDTLPEIRKAHEAITGNLYSTLRSLSHVYSVEEVEAFASLRSIHPNLYSQVEAAAFRLMMGQERHFVALETRREAHWLLVAIDSARVEEAWEETLTLPQRDMQDAYWQEGLVSEIACLSRRDTLPLLLRLEQPFRSSDRQAEKRTFLLVVPLVEAIAATGGDEGFAAWLDVLRSYDVLDIRVLDAISLITLQDGDQVALEEIATGIEQFTDQERMQVVYALRTKGDTRSGPTLLQCLQREPNKDVRMYAADGLSEMGFRDAIPTLRTERARANGDLLTVCTKALCRFGCQETTRELMHALQLMGQEVGHSPHNVSRLSILASYPEADELGVQIDQLIASLILVPSYRTRAAAMQALLIRHQLGRPQADAAEALATFVRRNLQERSIDGNEKDACQVLALLSPQLLCEVASSVKFADWPADGRMTMVNALGTTDLPEAVPALACLVQDPAYSIRRKAARSLAQHSETLIRPILQDMLAHDTRGAMYAAEALFWFDNDWSQTMQADLAEHEDQRVRQRIASIHEWRARCQANQSLLERYLNAITPRECWLFGKALQETADETVVAQLLQDVEWQKAQQHPTRYLVARRCLGAVRKNLQEHIDHVEKDWSLR